MKDLAVMFSLISKEKKDVLYSILFGFIAGVAAVALFASSGYLVSKAALAPPLYTLTMTIAFLKFISFLRAGSRYAERYFSHHATFTILSNLRVHFYNKLEPLAPGIFQKYRSGDLLARIVGDVEHLQFFFLRVFYPPIVMVTIFLSTIVFTLFFSVYVTLAIVGGLILTGFVIPAWFAYRQKKTNATVREERGALSTEAAELLYGFRDLKIHQRLSEQEKALTEASASYVKEQEKEHIQSAYSESVNGAVALTVTWIVLGIGAYLASTGELNGLFLAMLVLTSLTVFENSTPMASFHTHYEGSRQSVNRLSSVLDVKEDAVWENTSSLPQEAYEISGKNVCYTFPEDERQALKDVSFMLPAGSRTAIVGASGSGKSTLMQVMLNVLSPDSGDVRLAGKNTEQLDKEDIWRSVNVVLQENHFFYGTIADNLRIARDAVTDNEMTRALEKVMLSDFSLNDRVYEKGGNLSGGEKQRLAIARAMLKGAPLWVMDEPVSSVDSVTEKKVLDELYEQAKNDTLVLISHNLRGLERMDQIIVMNDGRIEEAGTYRDLMEKQGYFYKMKEIEKSILM
ncbi:thiol reductant ABC exporter subunit CydC [Alteribacter keqinensis]|uniref:Thiol reductant ABC exporter subunit CydC n=1 Tax=Alteribacter keqinensis TaxID=2483800 RepID=A0A3M7TY00_9BACI|nr:thiol reductant ABC exporter subunit CydC [Alteribacter keqinensis]RNA70480.1 thiol reductant ABC exporter subunit CydC [Alteribacter keqinensis]